MMGFRTSASLTVKKILLLPNFAHIKTLIVREVPLPLDSQINHMSSGVSFVVWTFRDSRLSVRDLCNPITTKAVAVTTTRNMPGKCNSNANDSFGCCCSTWPGHGMKNHLQKFFHLEIILRSLPVPTFLKIIPLIKVLTTKSQQQKIIRFRIGRVSVEGETVVACKSVYCMSTLY